MSTIVSTSSRAGRSAIKNIAESLPPRCSKILTVFGTRPEAIKLAPVIHSLESSGNLFQTVNVTSGQHTDLLYPLINLLGLRLDYDLQVMSPDQTPNLVCSRVLASLDSVLSLEQPDLILVQGDTTTALAGALAGFHRGIPVGHIEAGLRSHNPLSPYPEEMNRCLITKLATYHFAATKHNLETLLSEGVAQGSIFVTGNTVIDSLKAITERAELLPETRKLLEETEGLRRVVLTTHRRESFGEMMTENLRALRRFVEAHEDVALVFPVHPNPSVVDAASAILSGHERLRLIRPMNYDQFVLLLSQCWLILSDSGGVQEEAPTLGKPLLVLRENTERPEALESGVARLVGGCAERLSLMLEEVYEQGSWGERIASVENPFGQGDSGRRIAQTIAQELKARVVGSSK